MNRRLKDDQLDLFAVQPALPEGLLYRARSSRRWRSACSQIFESLPFREFEFQGYLGKRRVVSYGWRYDFNEKVLRRADDVPDYLRRVREIAARFAGIEPDALQQALVSGVFSGRRYRMASGQANVRRRDWDLAPQTVPFSFAAQARVRMGASLVHGRAPIGLSPSRTLAHRVGTQHPAGRGAPLLDHVPQLSRRSLGAAHPLIVSIPPSG